MSLRQLIINLFTEVRTVNLSGVGYAGTINIESGFAEISSDYFPPCDLCESVPAIVRQCRFCGRQKGNNVNFLAGRGDGVYSGVALYIDNTAAACLYVFDEDNKMAGAFSAAINDESVDFPDIQTPLLDSISAGYFDLPAFFAGTIKARFEGEVTSLGFVLGDAAATRNTTASVDHPFFNGSHSVYLFMESILESPVVQLSLRLGGKREADFNGGYQEAMRPRVVMIVNDKYERKLLKSVETNRVDWVRQASAWSHTQISSNIAGGNAGAANYYNGLFWLGATNRQSKLSQNSDVNDFLSFIQMNRSFGYFFAGALSGDDDCRQYVSEMIIEDDEPESFLEQGILSEILTPRGLEVTPEVLDLVRESLTPPEPIHASANFCSNCGVQQTAEARFCAACGSKLA